MATLIALVASLAGAQPPQRVKVLIGFPNAPGAAEEALLRAAGGQIRHRYHLVNAVAVSVPIAALEGLRRNPRVSVVEPDVEVRVADVELDNSWGVARIGAGIAHAAGNYGQGVRVAILDTGIDCTHPDLDGNCAGGIDFVNDDGDPRDDHGHGTHVAGTVAAEDDGTGVVGVAPKALLYALKTLDASGSGNFSDVIAALEWAVDNGIQVANHSYGSAYDPGSIVRAAFDSARAAGVVNVAAAGNSGKCPPSGDTVIYPAKYPSVIAVGATTATDSRACFSSTGPDVEVSAPGASIRSTRVGGGYTSKSGTSMATPHAAGVAALIMASGVTHPSDVRQRMIETADDLGASGKDDFFGYGLVDADEAAASAPVNAAPTVTVSAPTNGSSHESGASIQFVGSASDAEDGNLTSTLTWRSNLDGVIGSGGSFIADLRDGSHTVTASATDSGGRTGTRSISLTVSSTSASTVKVKSIGYQKYGGKAGNLHLSVVASLVDGSGKAVSGATVTLVVSTGSASKTISAVTDSTGSAVVSWKRSPAGCYASVVRSVASGLSWDGLTPANKFCK